MARAEYLRERSDRYGVQLERSDRYGVRLGAAELAFLSHPPRRLGHMDMIYDPSEVFADPVSYLHRLGVEAELVEERQPLPEAA